MKAIALAFSLITLSTPVMAAPLSFTGAELLTLPGVTFPLGTQSVIGDSLRFNGDGTIDNRVIAAFSLDQFAVDLSDFEVQIDLTRLDQDGGGGDYDLSISLSDGLNLFGGFFGDASSNSLQFQAQRGLLSTDGNFLSFREVLGTSGATTVNPNTSYLATLGVQVSATNTQFTGDINNGGTSFSASTTTLFDPGNGGPVLIFIANEPDENFQINAFTFTRGVSAPVPEPGAFGGLALGLISLGAAHRRRRSKAMIC